MYNEKNFAVGLGKYVFCAKDMQNAKLSLDIINVLPAKTIKMSLDTKFKLFSLFCYFYKKSKTIQMHQRSILKVVLERKNLDANISIICVLSSQKSEHQDSGNSLLKDNNLLGDN